LWRLLSPWHHPFLIFDDGLQRFEHVDGLRARVNLSDSFKSDNDGSARFLPATWSRSDLAKTAAHRRTSLEILAHRFRGLLWRRVGVLGYNPPPS
jgi:hypothetical protein